MAAGSGVFYSPLRSRHSLGTASPHKGKAALQQFATANFPRELRRAWQIPQLYANLTRSQNQPSGRRTPMRRAFLCHRCGAANRPAAENCAYCGLQVAWRPQLPVVLRFWRWPAARRETAGAASAILAALLETTLSLTILTLPLLTVSALLLTWSYLADDTSGRERP